MAILKVANEHYLLQLYTCNESQENKFNLEILNLAQVFET